MRASVGKRVVILTVGDISFVAADCIVNAANRSLLPGGGVDGAIHKAAGPGLAKEAKHKYPEGCDVGSAVATGAGFLQAQYVIHAVGPIWRGGTYDEPKQLRSAYQASLNLAAEKSCTSIAFPAISTGVFAYPIPAAAKIAMEAIRDFEHESGLPLDIRFALFSAEILKQFTIAMQATTGFEMES